MKNIITTIAKSSGDGFAVIEAVFYIVFMIIKSFRDQVMLDA